MWTSEPPLLKGTDPRVDIVKHKCRPGAARYTFIPDKAYKKELDAKADPNEVGDPPCGDWGDAPDGIQYFEVQPGSRSVLFVRVGQEAHRTFGPRVVGEYWELKL